VGGGRRVALALPKCGLPRVVHSARGCEGARKG